MTSSDSATPDPALVAAVVPLIPAWRVDRPFDYDVPPELQVKVGSLVRVPFGGRRVRGIVVAVGAARSEAELMSITAVVVDVSLAPPPLDELYEWLARRYTSQTSVALARAVPPRVRTRRDEIVPLVGRTGPERLRALERGSDLERALTSGTTGTWLLQCRPGENRGALVAGVLSAAAGRGAGLVAVPEVRFGSFLLDQLGDLWPEGARLDSARPDTERAASWLRMARGHGLGAGGRAAVLAPAPNLSVLVVAEEHNPAFKEDRAPRFEARIVAQQRSRLQKALCVLVSATPSVEVGAAALRGEIGWAKPGRAAMKERRPIVEFVERPQDRALSQVLHERVRAAVRRGDRVALLAARRGYARAVWCASCRRSLRCPVCEAGLFFDRTVAGGGSRVRCARCDFIGTAPDSCPTCDSSDWRLVGAGSERLAEQVARAFPRARVQRADPDVLDEVVESTAPPDIYVTTWIGTKPAVRPEVSVVGILDADSLIRRPDFRAGEHAYQAVAEMAEWAGPAGDGGRLVVQTSEPGHHALQAVARADYEFFLERELGLRRELGYPPFCELIKATAAAPGGREALAQVIVRARAHGARALGPIELGAGAKRRLEVLLKCDDAEPVAADLRGILAVVPPEARLRLDTDPR